MEELELDLETRLRIVWGDHEDWVTTQEEEIYEYYKGSVRCTMCAKNTLSNEEYCFNYTRSEYDGIDTSSIMCDLLEHTRTYVNISKEEYYKLKCIENRLESIEGYDSDDINEFISSVDFLENEELVEKQIKKDIFGEHHEI